jgi:hypothetical protein
VSLSAERSVGADGPRVRRTILAFLEANAR